MARSLLIPYENVHGANIRLMKVKEKLGASKISGRFFRAAASKRESR
jgi:hypothetical protein